MCFKVIAQNKLIPNQAYPILYSNLFQKLYKHGIVPYSEKLGDNELNLAAFLTNNNNNNKTNKNTTTTSPNTTASSVSNTNEDTFDQIQMYRSYDRIHTEI
eukprot:UN08515